jgi:ATP-dependent HslUV protease ATP-binding subunit HslU
MERLLEEVSFEAPYPRKKKLTVDGEFARTKLAAISKDEDLSRFIL